MDKQDSYADVLSCGETSKHRVLYESLPHSPTLMFVSDGKSR